MESLKRVWRRSLASCYHGYKVFRIGLLWNFLPGSVGSPARSLSTCKNPERHETPRCLLSFLLGLRCFPIESVDILGAGVADEEGRIVWRETQPASPSGGLAKILQADHLLQLVIADP